MSQVPENAEPTRGLSLWKWIAWVAALVVGLIVAVVAVDRYRMDQVRSEVESRGGRLYGQHYLPRWYEWLLDHAPFEGVRGLMLKAMPNFQRVVRVQLPGGVPAPHELIARLTRFKRLTSLELPNCHLTDADLNGLSKLTELRILNLGGNPVTDRGLEQLEQLRELHSLFLYGTQAEGRFLKHSANWAMLAHLEMSGSPIGDAGLGMLATASNLGQLYLVKTKITDVGLKSLAAQPSLFRLFLHDTRVSDEGLSALDDSRFPKLTELILAKTDVTAEGVSQLKLSRLSHLHFPDVAMTDEHWRRLAKMTSLDRVVWGHRSLRREMAFSPTGGTLVRLDSFTDEPIMQRGWLVRPRNRFPSQPTPESP